MENNLVILNDGSPTRVQKPNLRKPKLDLTMCCQSILYKSTWSLYHILGQCDNFWTTCVVSQSRLDHNVRNSAMKLNLKRTDWEKFYLKFRMSFTSNKSASYKG